MTARYVTLADLPAWLAKGWRLSRRPLTGHHAQYAVLIIFDGDVA